eukprot:scaffold57684_cov104-Phaeocystis_antarctica.AAC.3
MSDSRFQSWQYREMQDATNEPLGTIIGVALLDSEERCKHVFECYRPEPATGVGGSGPPCLDGADAFLLQTLGDYAGAGAVAIRQRWEQIRVAQLPAMLLASDSFAGFISRLREFLKEWFSVLDGHARHAPPRQHEMPSSCLARSCRSRTRVSGVLGSRNIHARRRERLPRALGLRRPRDCRQHG